MCDARLDIKPRELRFDTVQSAVYSVHDRRRTGLQKPRSILSRRGTQPALPVSGDDTTALYPAASCRAWLPFIGSSEGLVAGLRAGHGGEVLPPNSKTDVVCCSIGIGREKADGSRLSDLFQETVRSSLGKTAITSFAKRARRMFVKLPAWVSLGDQNGSCQVYPQRKSRLSCSRQLVDILPPPVDRCGP